MIKNHDIIYHLNGFIRTKAMYTRPARMKTIPPNISYLHDIRRTASRKSAGILWISNASAICQNPSSGEKTSKEKSDKNNMKTIDSILGVQ